jgi:hypothetical protein
MTPLTPDQLATRVEGHHLAPSTLAEVLDQRTTLLVFLRHYG